MRFGNARFGPSRFGTNALSGRAEIVAEVASDGVVSALSASGSTSPASVEVVIEGRPVSLDVTPTPPSITMDVDTVSSPSGGATTTSSEYHITAGGSGAISNTTLTIEARYPELIASASPERDIPERERIEGYLKRPFESTFPSSRSGGVHGPGEFSALVAIFGGMAEGITGTKNDVLGSRMIDIAFGQSLDNIGRLLLLPRRTGETDPHYRIRLKAHAKSLTGEATIDQIRETLAILLECDVEDIGLSEPDAPAQFDLTIDQTIVDAAAVTVGDAVELVKRFRAGGVKVTMTVTGSFMYRSIEDFDTGTDLGEHGYEEAGYSGRVI